MYVQLTFILLTAPTKFPSRSLAEGMQTHPPWASVVKISLMEMSTLKEDNCITRLRAEMRAAGPWPRSVVDSAPWLKETPCASLWDVGTKNMQAGSAGAAIDVNGPSCCGSLAQNSSVSVTTVSKRLPRTDDADPEAMATLELRPSKMGCSMLSSRASMGTNAAPVLVDQGQQSGQLPAFQNILEYSEHGDGCKLAFLHHDRDNNMRPYASVDEIMCQLCRFPI